MFYLLIFYLFIAQTDKQAVGFRCRKLFEMNLILKLILILITYPL